MEFAVDRIAGAVGELELFARAPVAGEAVVSDRSGTSSEFGVGDAANPPCRKNRVRRKRRRPEGRKRNEMVFLVAIMTVLLAIGLTVVFTSARAESGARTMPVNERLIEEKKPKLNTDAVIGRAVSFLRAPTWMDKLDYVRQSDRYSAHVREFYAGRESASEEVIDLVFNGKTNHGGVEAFIFHALMRDGDRRMLVFLQEADGVRLDWECYARFNPASWEQFVSERVPERTEFRLVVEKDEYSNRSYADAEAHEYYRLRNPDSDRQLFGYVCPDSDLGLRMQELFRGQPSRLLILDICYPDAGAEIANDQVEITAVSSVGWVRGVEG